MADEHWFNASYWIYQTVAMMATCALLPRLRVNGFVPAFLTVISLAFVNSQLWSAALFFEIPNTLTHRTITLLVANGAIFWVVVKLLPGIEIDGIFPAIAAPVIFTVLSLFIGTYAPLIEWQKVWERTYDIASKAKSYMEETKSGLEKPSSQGNVVSVP